MFSTTARSNMFHHLLTSTTEGPLVLPFVDGNNMTGPYSNSLHGTNGANNHHHYHQEMGHPGNKSMSGGRKNSGIEENFYKDLFTIMCYSLIILVSLCGNSLVLKVIASRKKLQTTTNILIASLAFADVLTTTLNVPFNVARFLFLNYPFGALFCKLVPFIQVCCVYVSTLTMGVIAIHRHITLSCPHRTYNTAGDKSFRSKASCRLSIILVIVWLIAAIFAIPHSMFNQIVYVPYMNVTYTRCRAEYPKFEFNLPFWLSVEAFLTQYLIPLSITCTLYIKIGFVVSKQGRLASNSNNRRKKEQDEARRRRIVMLALVVLVFALCWFPLNVYHLLVDFRVVKPNFTVFLVCHWIAMSSVCYNPFIYCWLNESFRKGAIKMLSFFACLCCRKQGAALTVENSSKRSDMSYAVSERFTVDPTANNTTMMTIVNSTSVTSNHNHHHHHHSGGTVAMKHREHHRHHNHNNSIKSRDNQHATQHNDDCVHQHGEQCPKSLKTVVNSKKEKRKFRKLRLSSFRKKHRQTTSSEPHQHHHHHNYENNNCNCTNVNNNNHQHCEPLQSEVTTTTTSTSNSGGPTTVTTIPCSTGGSNTSRAANYSSFESIISSINSSNASTSGSNCHSSSNSANSSSSNCCSLSGCTVCNNNNNNNNNNNSSGCCSEFDDAPSSNANNGNSANHHHNGTMTAVQVCTTVTTSPPNRAINTKSTFV